MATYKIIGADQSEYGPVEAESVRQWIAEGRANGPTLAQAEGGADWHPLSAFPEFADALAAKAAAPPPRLAAGLGAVDAEGLAREIIARDYALDLGSCFIRSWQLLQRHFWSSVAATVLFLMMTAAIACIPTVGGVASLVLAGVLEGGLCWYFLRLIRGEPANVGEVFAGFNLALVPLMLGGVVAHLLTWLGLLLCLLPGIYLSVAWVFNVLLIIDKKLGFWPAMELSRKVVTRHWFTVFGLVLLCWLVNLAGLLACLIGLFITLPLSFGAVVLAYQDIFGAPVRSAADLPALTAANQPDAGMSGDSEPAI